MKKIAIGCGLALVLAVIVGSVALYYAYSKAKTYVAEVSEPLSQVADMEKLNAQITNTREFDGPADGTLTADQVTRFVAVQREIKKKLGSRTSELEARYKSMNDGDSESRSFGEVVGAYRDLMSLVADAKQAQVAALNAQRFSLSEYQWVRARVFEAAGLPLSGVDVAKFTSAIQDAISKAAAGGQAPASLADAMDVPESNRTLVQPYKDELQEWVAFAAFGL